MTSTAARVYGPTEPSSAFLPHAVRAALESPSHVVQGDFVAAARTKAAAAETLQARGFTYAGSRALRVAGSGNAQNALADAGLLDDGAVLAWQHMQNGNPVVSVHLDADGDDDIVTIGHWVSLTGDRRTAMQAAMAFVRAADGATFPARGPHRAATPSTGWPT